MRGPRLFLFFFTLVSLWPSQAWSEEPEAKKLLYYGWDSPETQYVREHWPQMEEMPFDGVGMVVAVDRAAWQQGQRDTSNQLSRQIMGHRALQITMFREAIRDLQAARWRRCTDHFLPIALSSSQSAADLNWFDDERWRTVAHNFGVAAKIAAAGGMKGLILDPEHYNTALFRYTAQRRQVERSFGAYEAIARQRGKEVMAAVAAAMPNAVLLSLFGHTLPLHGLQKSERLHEGEYSLLPAFYDGLLEAMPARAELIDGYEFAYAFKQRGQFLDAYHHIHHTARLLSAVPARYRDKVRAGFGLWLDYKQQSDYFTPEELQRVVSTALEVSDKYVWIYTEGPRFFPPAGIEDVYIQALSAARRRSR